LDGLKWENVDIFYGRLKYFMDNFDILWPFGTFCVHLVHFSHFGIMHQEKSGNPAPLLRTYIPEAIGWLSLPAQIWQTAGKKVCMHRHQHFFLSRFFFICRCLVRTRKRGNLRRRKYKVTKIF
jgi:hypothetical protein